MSWQVASFACSRSSSWAAFAWYERSRPPARLVGLVAALAALAVAGRVLAPIPNVVATTDIALFTGYAIGGAPGFAVGALSALISNFWLGQGPWTPWQMAGWGWWASPGRGSPSLAAAGSGRGAGGRVRRCGARLRGASRLLGDGDLRRGAVARSLPCAVCAGHPVQRRPCGRQLALALVAGPALVRMLPRSRRDRVHLAATPSPRRSATRAGAGPRTGRATRRCSPGLASPSAGARRGTAEPLLALARAELRRRLRRPPSIRRAPRSPAGRCSASRRRAETRSTSAATGRRRSTT